jgi:hypothetical protein
VALALLASVEAQCEDWFTEPTARADAVRSVALARLQTVRAWRQSLSGAEPEREQAWCQAEQDRIIATHLSSMEEASVFRLQTAIPLLVSIPDASTTEPPEPQRSPELTGPPGPAPPPEDEPGQAPADAPPAPQATPPQGPPDPQPDPDRSR